MNSGQPDPTWVGGPPQRPFQGPPRPLPRPPGGPPASGAPASGPPASGPRGPNFPQYPTSGGPQGARPGAMPRPAGMPGGMPVGLPSGGAPAHPNSAPTRPMAPQRPSFPGSQSPAAPSFPSARPNGAAPVRPFPGPGGPPGGPPRGPPGGMPGRSQTQPSSPVTSRNNSGSHPAPASNSYQHPRGPPMGGNAAPPFPRASLTAQRPVRPGNFSTAPVRPNFSAPHGSGPSIPGSGPLAPGAPRPMNPSHQNKPPPLVPQSHAPPTGPKLSGFSNGNASARSTDSDIQAAEPVPMPGFSGPPAPTGPPMFGQQQQGPPGPRPFVRPGLGLPPNQQGGRPGFAPPPTGPTYGRPSFAPPPGQHMPSLAPVATHAPGSPSRATGSGRSPRRSPRRGDKSPRVDPKKLPRYPLEVQREPLDFDTRTMGQHGDYLHQIPRRSDVDVICNDVGTCGPHFMRVTTNNFPKSKDEANQSSIPLAVIISPLATPHPQDTPLPLLDYGPDGPPRCTRCRAYVNPFVRFPNKDQAPFFCNFCGARNTLSGDLSIHVDRPELRLGSVEYVAPPAYQARPPMGHWHVFVIDVTHNAMRMGASASICAAVKLALEPLAENPHTKVAIMAYHTRVQFFSIAGGTARMIVMSDVQDPYAPSPSSALASPSDPESLASLNTLLDTIPSLFLDSLTAESPPGAGSPSASQAALLAAVALVKSNGAKVHMFATEMPTVGVHKLIVRYRGAGGGTDETIAGERQEVQSAPDTAWLAAASKAAEASVCVDMIFLTQGYVDIAQHAVWPRITGGSLYHYHPFTPALDHEELVNDLLWNVRREQGLEALLRLRCSQGIDVASYHGSFLRRDTDLVLAALDCDKSAIVTLKHEDRLTAGAPLCLQSALLYSTASGQRRVRVHTISIPVASSIGAIFRGADLESTLQALVSRVPTSLSTSTIHKEREWLESRCVEILTAYRKHCATRSGGDAQLILPESLKLLPLYICMYCKTPALSTSAPPDARAVTLYHQSTATVRRIALTVLPRLVDVTQAIEDPAAGWLAAEWLPVSSESFNAAGVYVLDNGREVFLYIGPKAEDEVLRELFGVEGWHAMPPPNQPLLLSHGSASRLNGAVHALVDAARARSRCYMRFRVVCRGRPEERHFQSCIAEDRVSGVMSYIEFLCHVHRRICTNLRGR